jgi:hypothetical protein
LIADYDAMGDYNVNFDHGHGMGDVTVPGKSYQVDRATAQMLGPDAVQYVEDVYAKLRAQLEPLQAEVGVGEGNIFPNVSWLNFQVCQVFALLQWHPKGPDEIEVWQTSYIDSAAPPAVRAYARGFMIGGNTPAGLFGQDDGENFEHITASARGHVSLTRDFNYAMGLGHEGEVEAEGYPGRIGPHYTEQNQRNFYRYWLELMTAGGDAR